MLLAPESTMAVRRLSILRWRWLLIFRSHFAVTLLPGGMGGPDGSGGKLGGGVGLQWAGGFSPSSNNWNSILVGSDDGVRRKLDGVPCIAHGSNANQVFMKLRHDVPCFRKSAGRCGKARSHVAVDVCGTPAAVPTCIFWAVRSMLDIGASGVR